MKNKIILIFLFQFPILMSQNINLFTLCEGNFGSANSSLWSTSMNEVYFHESIHWDENSNPLGDVGQSLNIYDGKLYIVMNNSHTIEIMNLSETAEYEMTVELPNSSPRYITFNNNKGYISSWNQNAILVLNLDNMEIIDTVIMNGMPEYMVEFEDHLFVSLPNNLDWSTNDKVVKMRLSDHEIVGTFSVEPGPTMMTLKDSILYITSSSYDDIWNQYSGTSSINLINGEIQRHNAGQTNSYGSDIFIFQNEIYQVYDDGVVTLNNDLTPNISSKIGNLSSIYSAWAYEDNLIIGTSDYVAPDTVFILNQEGLILDELIVSAMPGSYAVYEYDQTSIDNNSFIPSLAPIQNYPNPFNHETVIQINVHEESPYQLYICDISGRIIEELKINNYTKGQKKIKWNGALYASGIYFAVFKQKSLVEITKLSLLK